MCNDNYADIIKPVSILKAEYEIVGGSRALDEFAAALGGVVVEQGLNLRRSAVSIYNADEGFTYECITVLARCSACNRRFYDITFTDNDGSITGCPHCGATLWW